MSSNETARIVFEEPFRPYRLRTVDGRSIDVRSPEGIAWGVKGIWLSTFVHDLPKETGQELFLPHEAVRAFEPLEATA